MTGRRHHRWAAWTAVLALLWAALAPAFADRVHTGTPAEMLQVCSVMGTMTVPLDDGSSSGHGAASGAGHCPWCSLQAHTPAMPVSGPLALALPTLRQDRPAEPPVSVVLRRPWAQALTRGPPPRV